VFVSPSRYFTCVFPPGLNPLPFPLDIAPLAPVDSDTFFQTGVPGRSDPTFFGQPLTLHVVGGFFFLPCLAQGPFFPLLGVGFDFLQCWHFSGSGGSCAPVFPYPGPLNFFFSHRQRLTVPFQRWLKVLLRRTLLHDAYDS